MDRPAPERFAEMKSVRPLLIMGTRPEAIKMAPVVHQCQHSGGVEPIVCFTGQHREMLASVAEYFGIQCDLDLDLMRENQSLAGFTARCLEGLDAALSRFQPDCVVAQGDTTTVMAASLAAFYRHLPFVHVEAGLRTGNLQAPWPEEFNRRVGSLTAALHCAPTDRAAANLLGEGAAPAAVHVTGNTVVDALLWTVARQRRGEGQWRDKYRLLGDQRVVLVTGHRRESFGAGMEAICRAIGRLAARWDDVQFVYPVHLNPHVREPVFRLLGGRHNVHLVEPAPYPEFVWLMDRATLILTDSGGVQEEAPSLKKPVLVMRETTERQEAVDAGAVRLVGTSEATIVAHVNELLTNPAAYARCQIEHNPYGDGRAAERIVNLLRQGAWCRAHPHRAAA